MLSREASQSGRVEAKKGREPHEWRGPHHAQKFTPTPWGIDLPCDRPAASKPRPILAQNNGALFFGSLSTASQRGSPRSGV